jgi:hypothetical protein
MVKKLTSSKNKKPKCTPGNKPCGERCIPASQKCHNKETFTNSPLKNKVALIGGLAATTAVGAGLILLNKKRPEPIEPNTNSPVRAQVTTKLSQNPLVDPKPGPVVGKDPLPLGIDDLSAYRRKLIINAPDPPNYNETFDNQYIAVESHLKQQSHYNKYKARVKAVEALQSGEKGLFLDLEMTGITTGIGKFTPLSDGEPVAIGIVSGGFGKKEVSLKIPIKPSRSISARDTRLHGIQDTDVAEALDFKEVYAKIKDGLEGKDIYTYGPTDLIWIDDACRRENLPLINYGNVVRLSSGAIDWDHEATTADVRKLFGDYLGPKITPKYAGYVAREFAARDNNNLSYRQKVEKYASPQGEIGYYIQLPKYDIPGIDGESHDPVVDCYRTKKLVIDIAKGIAQHPNKRYGGVENG